MPTCDMCGKESQLFIAEVEGTELNVCKNCAKYGKVIKKVAQPKPKVEPKQVQQKPAEPEKEVVLYIVSDYSTRIKNAREKMGLKQKELAAKLAERESLIQKMECGNFEPSIKLARKLEKVMNIILIQQHEEEKQKFGKVKPGALTIGDMISMKKRK